MNGQKRKQRQLEIILSENPATDEYHTWIRGIDDVLTLEEAIADPDFDYDEYDPDWTRKDAQKAIKIGVVRVYSSNKIGQGSFVTPSKMEAESYSVDGKVDTKVLEIDDIAWIDPTQGQVAVIKIRCENPVACCGDEAQSLVKHG